jgi:hypothetical protein
MSQEFAHDFEMLPQFPQYACMKMPHAIQREAMLELARPKDLVFIQQGTIPMIITAPRGGTGRVPGVAK